MALKDTIKSMKDLLEQISADLPKAENGNKAASQRVRTGTVKLEKTAKKYRKESISSEKGTKSKKKPAAKKAAKKSAPKSAPKSAAKHQAKPAQKKNPKKGPAKTMKSKRMTSRPSALMVKRGKMAKRPTAKLARKHAR
ncbi:histone [Estrella lausannensis]|uniref:Histone H1-like protein Hc1 n=1 Tax=Estrella lausannensis TaxID=483423 RepID=A0A0H5DN36_9BACT|nr:histone [Estrella lausannensis]CRX37646.1 Histone H1-like protein Hc1 [Estrella lausannensis]